MARSGRGSRLDRGARRIGADHAIDESAAEHLVALVEHDGLARGDRALGLVEFHVNGVVLEERHAALRFVMSRADARLARQALELIHGRDPVHVRRGELAVEKQRLGPDDERAVFRIEADDAKFSYSFTPPVPMPLRWPIV